MIEPLPFPGSRDHKRWIWIVRSEEMINWTKPWQPPPGFANAKHPSPAGFAITANSARKSATLRARTLAGFGGNRRNRKLIGSCLANEMPPSIHWFWLREWGTCARPSCGSHDDRPGDLQNARPRLALGFDEIAKTRIARFCRAILRLAVRCKTTL